MLAINVKKDCVLDFANQNCFARCIVCYIHYYYSGLTALFVCTIIDPIRGCRFVLMIDPPPILPYIYTYIYIY